MSAVRTPRQRTASALVFCGCAALLATVGLTWSSTQYEQARHAQETALQQLVQAQAALARTNLEQPQLLSHIAYFQSLQRRRWLEPAQRLEWLELLRDIRSTHRLREFSFSFSPQHPLTGAGEHALSSTLRLNMALAHEGQLMAFFQDLFERAPALLIPRRCLLASADETTDAPPAPLKVECEIDWVSFRVRNGP